MSEHPFQPMSAGGGSGGGGVSGLTTADGGNPIADNEIIRGDGTTGIQGSTVTMDDSGNIDAGAGVLTSGNFPASSTDNAVVRFNSTTGKVTQDSALTVSDLTGGVVTIAGTAGTALVVDTVEPAATTGASVVGDVLTLNAGDAVASTDTAGAAAGGGIILQGGAAARNTSGNADGGDVILRGGTGIGTGVVGQVLCPGGTAVRPGLSFESATGTGIFGGTNPEFTQGGSTFLSATAGVIALRRAFIDCNANALYNDKRVVFARTSSPYNINANNDGNEVSTNEGAGGPITINLPSAAAGLTYTFIVQSTNNLVITAATGDTIRIAAGVSSAGGTATNGTIGGYLQIVAINATEWIGGAVQGTWVLA